MLVTTSRGLDGVGLGSELLDMLCGGLEKIAGFPDQNFWHCVLIDCLSAVKWEKSSGRSPDRF